MGDAIGRDRPPAIADHALISNCQGSALVALDGTIDWACLPRFDSPALLASLLDVQAGHWSLRPSDEGTVSRRYLDRTMVLCTEWQTRTGRIEAWDLLPLGEEERGHHIGQHALDGIIRVVVGLEGSVTVTTDLALRPEYGLVRPQLTANGDDGVLARGGATAALVSGPTGWEIDPAAGTVTSTVTLEAGQRLAFGLRIHDPWSEPPDPWSQDELLQHADDTIAAWESWSELHQSYDGPYADLVSHSGRVLQALTYAPSGAVIAAPTTSLPEALGGSRNWDYRYAWVRDASLTLEALWVAACPDEAEHFFRFFATAAGTLMTDGDPLPIMYGVGGERHLPEAELDHLAGYRGSRPVRIGNGAWDQIQLDVYGEVLGAARLLIDQLGELDDITARFLCTLADAAVDRWDEPDQGIWEIRGEPRHFTYSKLMCWVAADRACQLADRIGATEEQAGRWDAARHEICAEITDQAWSESLGAFAQSFDSDELDASVLMMAIVGFLPPDDPRMRSTIEAIAAKLTDEQGLVYRYLTGDEMDGKEGTFALCTFWLAHCWALLGEVERARELCDRMVSYANDVGLFAEEIDPDTGELLGNFPQAFTHIGLVNAAWAIHVAERDDRPHTV
ncbi:MAG: glycoside hydrolase family 15 protein [Acidimicrobiia bacterium]|nr:glycoside hydrolase family 15 protein [Acidimicrobiia bacterium]